MKFKKILFFLFVALPFLAKSQDDMPSSIDEVIKWNFIVTYECDVATLTMDVEQKDGWHIYAQKQPAGAVSLPTSFAFVKNSNYQLIGKPTESATEEHNNDGFPE